MWPSPCEKDSFAPVYNEYSDEPVYVIDTRSAQFIL